MFKLAIALMSLLVVASAAELPSKKYLNLAALKTMVAAAEAEAQRQNVSVTICIVDESGNLLFLEKGDAAPLNTITWAQKKARHAAFYKSPSKAAEDTVRQHNLEALAYPDFFPNQGGLPSHRRTDSRWHLRQWRQIGDRRGHRAGRLGGAAQEISRAASALDEFRPGHDMPSRKPETLL